MCEFPRDGLMTSPPLARWLVEIGTSLSPWNQINCMDHGCIGEFCCSVWFSYLYDNKRLFRVVNCLQQNLYSLLRLYPTQIILIDIKTIFLAGCFVGEIKGFVLLVPSAHTKVHPVVKVCRGLRSEMQQRFDWKHKDKSGINIFSPFIDQSQATIKYLTFDSYRYIFQGKTNFCFRAIQVLRQFRGKLHLQYIVLVLYW